MNLASLANRPTESAFAQWVDLNLEREWVSFRHTALWRANGDIAREKSWRLIQWPTAKIQMTRYPLRRCGSSAIPLRSRRLLRLAWRFRRQAQGWLA